jgi:hypothetical protein
VKKKRPRIVLVVGQQRCAIRDKLKEKKEERLLMGMIRFSDCFLLGLEILSPSRFSVAEKAKSVRKKKLTFSGRRAQDQRTDRIPRNPNGCK